MMQVRWTPSFAAIGEQYASDNLMFLEEFRCDFLLISVCFGWE